MSSSAYAHQSKNKKEVKELEFCAPAPTSMEQAVETITSAAGQACHSLWGTMKDVISLTSSALNLSAASPITSSEPASTPNESRKLSYVRESEPDLDIESIVVYDEPTEDGFVEIDLVDKYKFTRRLRKKSNIDLALMNLEIGVGKPTGPPPLFKTIAKPKSA